MRHRFQRSRFRRDGIRLGRSRLPGFGRPFQPMNIQFQFFKPPGELLDSIFRGNCPYNQPNRESKRASQNNQGNKDDKGCI